MNLRNLLQEALMALTANKARSGLTILGIVIGIGSVIAMVSVGQGASGQIQASIESIGSNLITVVPGAQGNFSQIRMARGSATTLTVEDALAIAEQVSLVAAVAPEISKRYQITQKSLNTNTQVIGTVETYPEIKNIEMEFGFFISDRDFASFAKVAVLGPTTRDDLFGEGIDPINKTIKINGLSFKVIGVSATKGGTGFGSQDDMVFVPLSTAQRFLSGDKYVTSINVQAADKKNMTQVQNDITQLLLARHNINDPLLADFSVINQADLVQAATQTTDTFTILLAAIAGISLLVGGIGIMNMMLTTVTERTREIGLRKAIGAKAKDINFQFLTEAVALTLIGGVLGIALGYFVSFLISKFSSLTTYVSFVSIVLAFSISGLIGIIFGYWPAKRASKLNPIAALRYE